VVADLRFHAIGSREENEVVVTLRQEIVRTGRGRQKWETVARRRWEPGKGKNASGRMNVF
jgi:hypothetical protein